MGRLFEHALKVCEIGFEYFMDLPNYLIYLLNKLNNFLQHFEFH